MKSLIDSFVGLLVACSLGVSVARADAVPESKRSGRNQIVRVVTISQEGLQREANDLLEPTMARLDRAAAFHPDIACLPELFTNRAPEHVPGPVTDRLAAWAREHSSYVIFGLKIKRGERVYNSAILLDRTGQIVGQYDSIHPDEGQLKEGMTPGRDSEPPVFKTDFGTIGIQVCFDVNWREGWRHLKDQGAQIVFWPSSYPAARQLSALALWNEYYVVSSTLNGSAGIYDITGETMATTGKYQDWAGEALPLGKRLFETDYNVSKVREIQRRYGSRVEITWYHDSSWFTLASLDPDLSVAGLITEYGLTPLDDYIARSTKEINQARAAAEGRARAAR